jgi:hypothetical protein
MRPAVKRRLLTLAAAVSLVLCIATVALWVRSYFHWDGLQRTDKETLSSVLAFRGGMAVTLVRGQVNQLNRGWEFHSMVDWERMIERAPNKVELPGLSIAFRPRTKRPPYPNYRYLVFVVAYWLPFLLTAALPLIRLFVHFRQSSRGENRCPTCGYDLRATPDRCPECGAVLAGAAAR